MGSDPGQTPKVPKSLDQEELKKYTEEIIRYESYSHCYRENKIRRKGL